MELIRFPVCSFSRPGLCYAYYLLGHSANPMPTHSTNWLLSICWVLVLCLFCPLSSSCMFFHLGTFSWPWRSLLCVFSLWFHSTGDSTILPFITLVIFCFFLGVFHWMLSSVEVEPGSPFIHHWSPSNYQLAWYISWAQKYLMINGSRTKKWREYVFPEIDFCAEGGTYFKKQLLKMKWYQKIYWLTEKHNIRRPHSENNKMSLKAG